MKLPRGASSDNFGLPTATARWATREEILSYAHREGAIRVGTTPAPHPDAKQYLDLLAAVDDELAKNELLDPAWKARQHALIQQFREALEVSSRASIGINDDRHMITVAGSRAGKLTTAIAGVLCEYPGSVIATDPKGELSKLTAARRGRGSARCKGMNKPTYVVDGYRVSDLPDEFMASFNPLDLLDPKDDQVIDRASMIVNAIVIRAGGDHSHFDDNAIGFLKGLLLYIVSTEERSDSRNLIRLYDLANCGLKQKSSARGSDGDDEDDAIFNLIYEMSRCEALDGVIAAAGNLLLDMGERERGSVLSTARRNLAFLERPAVRRMLCRSTFSFDEMKKSKEGASIYICLPSERQHDCQRILRLAVTCGMQSAYDNPGPAASGHPILFLLEEFASLGHMEMIETAAGYAAGFGVKLWVILQDLAQLKRHYKQGWETFLGNAGVIQAFGNSDLTTLEYISKKLGQTETIQPVQSVTTSLTSSTNDPGEFQRLQPLLQSRGAGLVLNPIGLLFDSKSQSSSTSTTNATNNQVQRSSLMQPDEIERYFRREAMNQIVLLKGERPFALGRENYYEDPDLLGLYEPDRPPFHDLADVPAIREEMHRARAKERQDLFENTMRYVSDLRATINHALKQTKRQGA